MRCGIQVYPINHSGKVIFWIDEVGQAYLKLYI